MYFNDNYYGTWYLYNYTKEDGKCVICYHTSCALHVTPNNRCFAVVFQQEHVIISSDQKLMFNSSHDKFSPDITFAGGDILPCLLAT